MMLQIFAFEITYPLSPHLFSVYRSNFSLLQIWRQLFAIFNHPSTIFAGNCVEAGFTRAVQGATRVDRNPFGTRSEPATNRLRTAFNLRDYRLCRISRSNCHVGSGNNRHWSESVHLPNKYYLPYNHPDHKHGNTSHYKHNNSRSNKG